MNTATLQIASPYNLSLGIRVSAIQFVGIDRSPPPHTHTHTHTLETPPPKKKKKDVIGSAQKNRVGRVNISTFSFFLSFFS